MVPAMGIILATLKDLAKTLGCSLHQLDCVKEERSARAAIDRRGFFKAVGAVAAGVCMPLSIQEPVLVGSVYSWADIQVSIGDLVLVDFESISFEPASELLRGAVKVLPFGYYDVKA